MSPERAREGERWRERKIGREGGGDGGKEKEAKAGLSEKAVAPVEGRVLRSTPARRAAHDLPPKPAERSKPGPEMCVSDTLSRATA